MCNLKQRQEQQSCMQCTKRCLKIHGKKRPSSPSHFTFFKIMIGDFQETMFIPPKFALTFGHLLDKESHLEDSDGRSWRVGFSVVDGSLAFQQGWRDFVLDHSIEVGELVVFKYTGASFSVQIFATSACERLHFSKTNDGNKHKRKRNKITVSPECLHFEEKKGKHSKEDLRGAHEDSGKEGKAIEPVPCDLSKILEGDFSVLDRSLGEISFISLCEGEDMEIEIPNETNPSPVVDSSGGIQIKYLEGHGKGNFVANNGLLSKYSLTNKHTSTVDHLNHESSGLKQEGTSIPPIALLNPGTVKRQCYPQDSNISLVVEDNLSCQLEKLQKPQTKSEVECIGSETTNKSEASWAIVTYSLTASDWMGEQAEREFHNEQNRENEVATSFSRCTDANLVERDNSFASNGVVHEFLISEEKACCNVDGDIVDKFEGNRDAPIIMHHTEIDHGACASDEAVMPSSELIQDTRTKEKLGSGIINASRVDSVGIDPLTMPDVSDFPKDTERISFRTGMMPEDSRGGDEEKVDSNLLEKPLAEVKVESMELDELPLPNRASFTFSASVNTRPWLILPRKLPSRIGRRKQNKKMVTLRDPSMRLWPVLYYESRKFVGFICGWVEFVNANNLHEGDLCQFELTGEREPTFQVRRSPKAQ